MKKESVKAPVFPSQWTTIPEFLLATPLAFQTEREWQRAGCSYETSIRTVLAELPFLDEPKHTLIVSMSDSVPEEPCVSLLSYAQKWAQSFLSCDTEQENVLAKYQFVGALFKESTSIDTLDFSQLSLTAGNPTKQAQLHDFLQWLVIYPHLKAIHLHPDDGLVPEAIMSVLKAHRFWYHAFALEGILSFPILGGLTRNYYYESDIFPSLHDMYQQSYFAAYQLLEQWAKTLLSQDANKVSNWLADFAIQLKVEQWPVFFEKMGVCSQETAAWQANMMQIKHYFTLLSRALAQKIHDERQRVMHSNKPEALFVAERIQLYKKTVRQYHVMIGRAEVPESRLKTHELDGKKTMLLAFKTWFESSHRQLAETMGIQLVFSLTFSAYSRNALRRPSTPVVLLTKKNFRYIPVGNKPEQAVLKRFSKPEFSWEYWKTYFQVTSEDIAFLKKGKTINKGTLSFEQKQQLIEKTGYLLLADVEQFQGYTGDLSYVSNDRYKKYADEWFNDLFWDEGDCHDNAYRWVLGLISHTYLYHLDLGGIVVDLVNILQGKVKIDYLLDILVRCCPTLVQITLNTGMPPLEIPIQEQLKRNQIGVAALFIEHARKSVDSPNWTAIKEHVNLTYTQAFYESCKGLQVLLCHLMKEEIIVPLVTPEVTGEEVKGWHSMLKEKSETWREKQNYDLDAHQEWLDLAEGINHYFSHMEKIVLRMSHENNEVDCSEWKSVSLPVDTASTVLPLKAIGEPRKVIERRDEVRKKHWSHQSLIAEEQRRNNSISNPGSVEDNGIRLR